MFSVVTIDHMQPRGLEQTISRTLRLLLVCFFLIAGVAKSVGDAQHVAEFTKVGLGQWFRYFTGIFEVTGAVMLMSVRLVPIAAALLGGEMVIATALHLTLLQGSATPAVCACVASTVLLWLHRRQLYSRIDAFPSRSVKWASRENPMPTGVRVVKPAAGLRSSVIKWGGLGVSVVLALLFCAIGYVIYVGNPSRASSVKFLGYIYLPRHGPFNGYDYMSVSRNTLLVGNVISGPLAKISLRNTSELAGPVSELPGGGGAHGTVIMPRWDKAFVTRSGENTVDVFDPKSLKMLGRIPVADDPDAIIYDPTSQLIYVTNGASNLATAIDPGKQAIARTIPLKAKPEYAAADPSEGIVYQNLHDTNAIAAVNVAAGVVVNRWPLAPCAGPSGLTLEVAQSLLYAVCADNSELVIFSIRNHHVIASLAVGGKPDSVAYDAALHRIYCTGLLGTLVVVEQRGSRDYRVLDRIHTHLAAHTLAVDPATHRVYVAYATLLAQPRLAVFAPRD